MAKKDKEDKLDKELAERDPRVRDVVIWQRLRMMAEREALHPAWVCEVGRLHRLGKLDNDEKRAADLYLKEVVKFGGIQSFDPDLLDDRRKGRLYAIKDRMDELRLMLDGRARGRRIRDALNALVVHDKVLTEKGLRDAKDALQVIIAFFGLKNKPRTKRV